MLALVSRDARKAKARFRQAITVAPHSGPAHRGLATALAMQGQLQAGIVEAEPPLQASISSCEKGLIEVVSRAA